MARVAANKPALAQEPDDLAQAIVKISEGMAALQRSGLNRRAINVLLHDHTGVAMTTVDRVLSGLSDLKLCYTR